MSVFEEEQDQHAVLVPANIPAAAHVIAEAVEFRFLKAIGDRSGAD